jgi:hypothetical protein
MKGIDWRYHPQGQSAKKNNTTTSIFLLLCYVSATDKKKKPFGHKTREFAAITQGLAKNST